MKGDESLYGGWLEALTRLITYRVRMISEITLSSSSTGLQKLQYSRSLRFSLKSRMESLCSTALSTSTYLQNTGRDFEARCTECGVHTVFECTHNLAHIFGLWGVIARSFVSLSTMEVR